MTDETREARHLARCATCREDGAALGAALRALSVAPLGAVEQARIRAAIRGELAAPHAGWLPAVLPWLRGVARRRPTFAWAAAAAAVVTLVLAPLHIGRETRVFSQAELNAQTWIEHIDAAPSTSVLVLETPKEHLSIIWVMEPPAL
ncbi:MAG: hypothetical protein HY616_10005 [Candidatus Rokubacteria bacterium]|nr:hypothetical protein [Candidatus Rokubacteria bacterium]